MRIDRRKLKFRIIRITLLPMAVVVARLIFFTCRLPEEELAKLRPLLMKNRPLVLASLHGMGLGMLAAWSKFGDIDRLICVMTSPSRDGLALDYIISRFRINPIKGSSKKRAIRGAVEIIRAVREGQVAVMAVDGPRGPILKPKAGFATIAQKANADVYTIAVTARPALKIKSWDRLFIPLPFARLELALREFPLPPDEPEETMLLRLEKQLEADTRAIASPCAEGFPKREDDE